MRSFALIGSVIAAAALLADARSVSAREVHDPMQAARDAPVYDILGEAAGASPQPAAAETPVEPVFDKGQVAGAAAYDPMAAARGPADEAAAVEETAVAEPNPELGGLPDGPGAEETYYQCIACHSTAIIRQQHLTDERWESLWHWMINEQGMIEPDEETKQVILTYLKQNFSSER